MKAKTLIQALMQEHPDWEWDDIDGRGFFEIMQTFRHAPSDDQRAILMCFAVVKQYIRYLIAKRNREITDALQPRRISVRNKDYEDGYFASFKEANIITKKKKSKAEERYIELANVLQVDIQTVFLIGQMANGYKMTKEQIAQWAKKQSTVNTKHRRNSKEYYKWLAMLIHFMPKKTFIKFYLEEPLAGKSHTIGLITILEKANEQTSV